MGKEIIMHGDIEIEKRKFHRKNLILLEDVGIDNILISIIVSSGEKHKHFIFSKMTIIKLNYFV